MLEIAYDVVYRQDLEICLLHVKQLRISPIAVAVGAFDHGEYGVRLDHHSSDVTITKEKKNFFFSIPSKKLFSESRLSTPILLYEALHTDWEKIRQSLEELVDEHVEYETFADTTGGLRFDLVIGLRRNSIDYPYRTLMALPQQVMDFHAVQALTEDSPGLIRFDTSEHAMFWVDSADKETARVNAAHFQDRINRLVVQLDLCTKPTEAPQIHSVSAVGPVYDHLKDEPEYDEDYPDGEDD